MRRCRTSTCWPRSIGRDRREASHSSTSDKFQTTQRGERAKRRGNSPRFSMPKIVLSASGTISFSCCLRMVRVYAACSLPTMISDLQFSIVRDGSRKSCRTEVSSFDVRRLAQDWKAFLGVVPDTRESIQLGTAILVMDGMTEPRIGIHYTALFGTIGESWTRQPICSRRWRSCKDVVRLYGKSITRSAESNSTFTEKLARCA